MANKYLFGYGRWTPSDGYATVPKATSVVCYTEADGRDESSASGLNNDPLEPMNATGQHRLLGAFSRAEAPW